MRSCGRGRVRVQGQRVQAGCGAEVGPAAELPTGGEGQACHAQAV